VVGHGQVYAAALVNLNHPRLGEIGLINFRTAPAGDGLAHDYLRFSQKSFFGPHHSRQGRAVATPAVGPPGGEAHFLLTEWPKCEGAGAGSAFIPGTRGQNKNNTGRAERTEFPKTFQVLHKIPMGTLKQVSVRFSFQQTAPKTDGKFPGGRAETKKTVGRLKGRRGLRQGGGGRPKMWEFCSARPFWHGDKSGGGGDTHLETEGAGKGWAGAKGFLILFRHSRWTEKARNWFGKRRRVGNKTTLPIGCRSLGC